MSLKAFGAKANECGGFQYHTKPMFYNSGCVLSSRRLLLFRTFAAVFHWSILIIRLRESERLPAFCYLTNIVYLLCTLYYTIAIYNSISMDEETMPMYQKLFQSSQVFRMDKLCYEEKNPANLNLMCRIQWLLHSIALNLGLLVSLMYFLLIYNPATETLSLTNVSRHILNSLFILTEFSLNMIAVKFIHILYSLCLACLYAFYTVLFWYVKPASENYIYEIVNWDKPFKTTVLITILMCAVIVLNLLLIGASKIKFRYIIPFREPPQSFLV